MSEVQNYEELQKLAKPNTIDKIAEILKIKKNTLYNILDDLNCANSSINKRPETDYIKTPQGFEFIYVITQKGIESILYAINYQESKSKGTKEVVSLQRQYDELAKTGNIIDLGDKTITQSAFKKLEFPGFKTKNESEQMISAWWQHIRGEHPKWFKLSSLYAKHMHDYMKYLETKKDN